MGFIGKMLVPGPGLASQFGDESVHFGVELNHHFVGVVVVAGQIVTRRMSRGAPELFHPRGARVSAAMAC